MAISVTAVYPGTFDPMTLGHEDVVRRASQLFDKLIAYASAAIPSCRGSAQLRTLVRLEAKRLVPQELTRKLAPSVTRIAA